MPGQEDIEVRSLVITQVVVNVAIKDSNLFYKILHILRHFKQIPSNMNW